VTVTWESAKSQKSNFFLVSVVSVQPETRLKNIAISGTLLKASKSCGGYHLACMAGTEVKNLGCHFVVLYAENLSE
jgi:hypothetical protein